MSGDKEHTPLPYHCRANADRTIDGLTGFDILTPSEEHSIATTYWHYTGEKYVSGKVNAEFIVRACNEYYENKRKADSHYELLELVKDIDYIFTNIWELDRKALEKEFLPRFKAAITKAEGK